MAISKDDILSAIEEMSVMDLVELISAIEEKFGVTAAAAVAAAVKFKENPPRPLGLEACRSSALFLRFVSFQR